VVPPPPDTNSVGARYRIKPRARLSIASLETGAPLLSLDGRTLAYRPEGAGRTAAGGYLPQARPDRDGAPRLLAP